MVSLLQCDSCRKAQNGISHPNQNELHRACNLQKMTPRSPRVGIARNTHGVVLHQELAVSYDSLFNVPRYREKLIAVSSGLKMYSLEEDWEKFRTFFSFCLLLRAVQTWLCNIFAINFVIVWPTLSLQATFFCTLSTSFLHSRSSFYLFWKVRRFPKVFRMLSDGHRSVCDYFQCS